MEKEVTKIENGDKVRDSFGREINYLRVSLTDRCNLRCKYCMPKGGIENKLEHKDTLNLEEIYHIIEELAGLGISKIRFTGGEPLVRRGIVDLISMTKKIPGIKEIAMTTNALLLKKYAKELKEAGLDRVNISLDTLNRDKYKEITRGGSLEKVLEGIEIAKEVGLTPIKINTVLIGGFNDSEIEDFINLTIYDDIDVRFIELMPIGEAQDFSEDNFISNDLIIERNPELIQVIKADKASPANYYKHPDAKGKIGIINPISCKFCSNCNRIRLTSTGKLKLCLHSNREIDLRSPIRNGDNIRDLLIDSILSKEKEHKLEDKEYISRNMNQIGG